MLTQGSIGTKLSGVELKEEVEVEIEDVDVDVEDDKEAKEELDEAWLRVWYLPSTIQDLNGEEAAGTSDQALSFSTLEEKPRAYRSPAPSPNIPSSPSQANRSSRRTSFSERSR